MKQSLLLVEDEKSIAEALVFALKQEGFDVTWVTLASEALEVLASQEVGFIILDVGLPDLSGFELCKKIRESYDTPILFLTARKEEVDRLIGLEIGGDDYVTKPFSLREVVSRVKVILRRYSPSASSQAVMAEQFDLNSEAMEIAYFSQALDLTRYEYRILKVLVENPNRVYTRAMLMDAAWDEPERSFERSVDTHVKTIRAKLKAIRAEFMPIKTHHGTGYSFDPNVFTKE